MMKSSDQLASTTIDKVRASPSSSRIEGTPAFDIEGQVSVAAGLLASDLDFRQIVDRIPALIAVMNAAGGVEFLNRQLLEYSGKTFEELKDWAISEALHPDDLPGVVAAWKRSVETGNPFENEHRRD